MIDQKFKAWLIEVNASPSYNMDSAIDRKVKFDLIHDTFKIIEANLTSKQKLAAIDKLEAKR